MQLLILRAFRCYLSFVYKTTKLLSTMLFSSVYCFVECVTLIFFSVFFQNGALSAIPYIGRFLACIFAGHLADALRSKNMLSTTATRKLMQAICKTFIIIQCLNKHILIETEAYQLWLM